MSNQINDTITVDLHDQIISDLPITDPDELEDVLINAADKLTYGREPVILEALMNTLVDFYVFTMEPGNDEEDIGFLVSNIEDKVCDAVSFRKTMIDNGAYDFPDDESPVEDDEDDDLPQPICCDRYCDAAERPVQESDSDDIRDKDVPGMMKRFESDGFEVTVTLIPKNEFE